MAERRIKAILEAQDRASPTFRRVSGAVKALGLVAAAVGINQIGRQLVRGLQSAVKAAGEYEAAAARLSTALANQGRFTPQAARSLREFARSLTEVSLATETQILGATAQAIALGASEDAAKRLTTAAVDLAAATGVDMETAFRQINRTLGGYAGELGEVIPELKALTSEQLKAGEGAEVIARKFGGAGEVIAKTFEGSVNNLNSALTQLQVAIGAPIRDVLTVLNNTVLRPLVATMRDAAINTGSFRNFVFDAAVAVTTLALRVEQMIKLISIGFPRGLEAIGNAAENTRAAIAARLIPLLDGLVSALPDKMEKRLEITVQQMLAQIELTKRELGNVTLGDLGISPEVSKALKEIEDRYKAIFDALAAARTANNDFSAEVGGLGESIDVVKDRFVGFMETVSSGMTELQAALLDLQDTFSFSFEEFTIRFAAQAQNATNLVLDLTNQLGQGLSNAIGRALFEGRKLSDGLKDLFKSLGQTLIEFFVQAGIQAVLASVVAGSAMMKQHIARMGQLAAQTYAAAFAAIAAIPIIGPALAPGAAAAAVAAMLAGATAAYGAGTAQGALAGLQHGAIIPGVNRGGDSVPFVGQPGEAVLPRQLTEFLLQAASRGFGGGAEVIELRMDEGIVARRLSDGVQRGSVRLVASRLKDSRVTR